MCLSSGDINSGSPQRTSSRSACQQALEGTGYCSLLSFITTCVPPSWPKPRTASVALPRVQVPQPPKGSAVRIAELSPPQESGPALREARAPAHDTPNDPGATQHDALSDARRLCRLLVPRVLRHPVEGLLVHTPQGPHMQHAQQGWSVSPATERSVVSHTPPAKWRRSMSNASISIVPPPRHVAASHLNICGIRHPSINATSNAKSTTKRNKAMDEDHLKRPQRGGRGKYSSSVGARMAPASALSIAAATLRSAGARAPAVPADTAGAVRGSRRAAPRPPT